MPRHLTNLIILPVNLEMTRAKRDNTSVMAKDSREPVPVVQEIRAGHEKVLSD